MHCAIWICISFLASISTGCVLLSLLFLAAYKIPIKFRIIVFLFLYNFFLSLYSVSSSFLIYTNNIPLFCCISFTPTVPPDCVIITHYTTIIDSILFSVINITENKHGLNEKNYTATSIVG